MSSSGREKVVSSNDREFIINALTQGVRMDGREPHASRALNLVFGQKAGEVEVQLGRTRCIACATGDIVVPFPDRPAEGFLNIAIDFSPMASPYFDTNRPSDKCVEVAQIVDRGIRDSKAVDTEALCIVAGEKVWSIRVDVKVVDYEGNMTDCCNLAAVAALMTFRRPDVTVVGGEVTVHNETDKNPVGLALHHVPISTTFAFIDDEYFVVDPALKEEIISQGCVTITVNQFKQLCGLQKAGGISVSGDKIKQCASIAYNRTLQLNKYLQGKIKEAGLEIVDKVQVNAQGQLDLRDQLQYQNMTKMLKAAKIRRQNLRQNLKNSSAGGNDDEVTLANYHDADDSDEEALDEVADLKLSVPTALEMLDKSMNNPQNKRETVHVNTIASSKAK
jgi:exosome complex component RRP45